MYEEYSEQGIDGLNEKIMKIVEELKGDHSEVEILDRIIHQSKLLFTTYKVRDLFKNNLEYCSEPIVDESTGKVREDMADFANRINVVRIQTLADEDQLHTIALLNVALPNNKTYEIMTVFDRTIELVDMEGNAITEEDAYGMDEGTVDERTLIQYLLRIGEVGSELKTVVDFEFTQAEGCCDDCCDEECEGCHHHHHEENENEDGEEVEEDYDDEEYDDDIEEELRKLDFDMDVLEVFRNDCGVSISAEDLLSYLVSMEFWEEEWEINDRLAEFIDEMRQ